MHSAKPSILCMLVHLPYGSLTTEINPTVFSGGTASASHMGPVRSNYILLNVQNASHEITHYENIKVFVVYEHKLDSSGVRMSHLCCGFK
jgi:hypothetical protein